MSDTLLPPTEDDLILTIATDLLTGPLEPLPADPQAVDTGEWPGEVAVDPLPDTGAETWTDPPPVTDGEALTWTEEWTDPLAPGDTLTLPTPWPDTPDTRPTLDLEDGGAVLRSDVIVSVDDIGVDTPVVEDPLVWEDPLMVAYSTAPQPWAAGGSATGAWRPSAPPVDGPPHGDTLGTAWLAGAWASAGAPWGGHAAGIGPIPAGDVGTTPLPVSGDTATELPALGLDWLVEDCTVL